MNFRALKNVLIREFKHFFKTPDLLLICIISPLIYAFLFSALYYNKRASDINIGIVNYDNTATSRKLIRYFDASPELKVTSRPSSAREAYLDIFHNDLGAFYFIPKNFSADLKKGKSAAAFNAADASSFLIASNVLKNFSQISSSFSEKQFTKLLVDKGYPYEAAKSASSPLKTNFVYLFNTEMNYSDFFIPVLLFAVLQQILIVSICSTMITDKNPVKKKELYKTAEGSFTAVFLGKTIPYICVVMALVTAHAFTSFPANNIYVGSFAAYLTVSAAFMFAVASFAVLISSFFRSQEMAMAVLMFYSMPAVLLSGFAWPHHALPHFLKLISYLFPSTYAINPLRMFILGELSLQYALIPAASLMIFSAACFAVSFIYAKNYNILDTITAKARKFS